MRGRSGSLAVLLAACGLLTADGVDDAADGPSTRSNDPYCSPSLSVVLENSTDDAAPRSLENNGSYVHDGIDYPAEFRWTDGNITYGCICKLRYCLRKCCGNDEVLRSEVPTNLKKEATCQKMPQNDTELTDAKDRTPDLRLAIDQMSTEIKHIDKLRKHFHLVQDNVCSSPVQYTVNPNRYDEDAIILQANGSFVDVEGRVIPFWNYCIDWKVTVDQIGILVCWTPEMQSAEPNEETFKTHHHVGIMISIPFLVATFLVYAITPELRNLYGKTLMCYVICLIIAYVFLILVNYIYMSPIRMVCLTTGKQRPYPLIATVNTI